MNVLLARWFAFCSGPPTLRIHGKGVAEAAWREIAVYARHRRDLTSRWPFFGGTCITWTSQTIAVGCDFAELLLREQMDCPASTNSPVVVAGQRLRNPYARRRAAARTIPTASEIVAHECGHTCQALRWPFAYLLIGALFTWWREGPHWWNWFENEASAIGMFGGIVSNSVDAEFWQRACAESES